jgi:HTH-type transcriptional regulator, sugar sensing transcriptional regulator
MDQSILENLGLTGGEIKVFLALLGLGSCSAGLIVEKSGLQNAVVHRALHSLAEKGLVIYALEGKIKKYQTIEPRFLLNILDEKKAQLQAILPELEAKRMKSISKPQSTMFQGTRGVKELISLMLETDSKEYLAYGGGIKSDEVLGTAFWGLHQKNRIKKNIKAELIFSLSLKSWGNKIKRLRLTDVRYTEKVFEDLTETIICGNKVAIIIYAEKPFGFLIEEERVADSYARFFQLLWKQIKF